MTKEPKPDIEPLPKDSLAIVLEGIAAMDEVHREKCRKIISDNLTRFQTAPGSRHNHQAWPGGYLDHVADIFKLGKFLMDFEPGRHRPFNLADFYLVMFLHDIEKPFAYSYDDKGKIVVHSELKEKQAKKDFRDKLIEEYELPLTDQHRQALRYVEKIPEEEYSPNERTMDELSAFCHVADTWSARVDHAYPTQS